jgi:molecular chaperone DnaK (HSP70)
MVKGFFDNAIQSIVEHVHVILHMPEVRGTSAVLMVGGFSESPMLQDAIRKAFPKLRIIIPRQAGLAVLIGAVIYGHNPSAIGERKCKYTYGIAFRPKFIEGEHPARLRFVNDFGEARCMNCFDIHVTEGDTVKLGESQREMPYSTTRDDQTFYRFKVYVSTNSTAKYITDSGCTKLGELVVPVPRPGPGKKHINVCMVFGGTELEVRGRDKQDNCSKGRFNFLGDM